MNGSSSSTVWVPRECCGRPSSHANWWSICWTAECSKRRWISVATTERRDFREPDAPSNVSKQMGDAKQSSFTALTTAVQWSHRLLEGRLRPGDWAVDATAGNGHDTVFLAQRVLPGG